MQIGLCHGDGIISSSATSTGVGGQSQHSCAFNYTIASIVKETLGGNVQLLGFLLTVPTS